jgi:transposase
LPLPGQPPRAAALTHRKRASEVFARGNKAPAGDDAQKVIDDLHRKIGQLQVERDFLAGQPAISRLLRGGR